MASTALDQCNQESAEQKEAYMKTKPGKFAGHSVNHLDSLARCGVVGRRVALWWLLSLIGLCAISADAGPLDVGGKKSISVYQANAYIGAEIEGILSLDPTTPDFVSNLLYATTTTYMQIQASEPGVRMEALAQEIAEKRPDLAGLEELYSFEIAPATAQGPGEFTTTFDYLKLLTTALAAKGAAYEVVVVSTEGDVTLPLMDPQTGQVVYGRLIDHEVILARSDLPPGYLRLSNPQKGTFKNIIQIPELNISVARGWCSVDVVSRGEPFRFICSHLEVEDFPPLQYAQALELLAGPANTKMPVVLVGDFNADPLGRTGTDTYSLFPAAGFKDAWLEVNSANPAGGLTWGHDPFLADPTAPFSVRIDFVLYRAPQFTPVLAEVLDPTLNSTQPPMWPSDHAAVSAAFMLGNPKSFGKNAERK